MAANANRNNIEPMGFTIAFVVMVLLCLVDFALRTDVLIRPFHLSFCYGMAHVAPCFCAVRVSLSGQAGIPSQCPLPGLGLLILLLLGLGFWGIAASKNRQLPLFRLAVTRCCLPAKHPAPWRPGIRLCLNRLARLAISTKPVLCAAIFGESRNRANFFARTALFWYDRLRHGFFLLKKLCLEPLQALRLCGSCYYIISAGGVKCQLK